MEALERLRSFHNVIIITKYQIQLYNQASEHEINHILPIDTDLKSEGKTRSSPNVYSWKKRFWSGLKTTKFRKLL